MVCGLFSLDLSPFFTLSKKKTVGSRARRLLSNVLSAEAEFIPQRCTENLKVIDPGGNTVDKASHLQAWGPEFDSQHGI